MTALIIDSTVRGRTCQRTGTRARGLAAEKQGAAQLLPLFFPFPFPFPFPLPFVFPFAFPFPLLLLALLLAALVGAVGVFAPLVTGLALWPEIFPVSPVLGTG